MALLDKLQNAIMLLRRSAVQWILNAEFTDAHPDAVGQAEIAEKIVGGETWH